MIENKTARFDPPAFTDRFQAALLDLVKAKLNGNPPIQVAPAAAGQVINLLEALKQSVEETGKVKALPEGKPRKIKPALAG